MSMTNNQINILNQTIGIAGCGEMGYPMLKVLLENDINATGHDVKESDNFNDLLRTCIYTLVPTYSYLVQNLLS